MLDRSLRARSVVGLGAAAAALALATPLAAAAPGPLFMPHGQIQTQPTGEAPSRAVIREKLGEIGAWAVPPLRTQTPRLGEGLTAADRSWLVPTASTRPVVSPTNGFDWDDAGIGAGTAAAAVLVIGGSVVAVRRRVSPAQ